MENLFKAGFIFILLLVSSCSDEIESVTKGQADIDYGIILKQNEKKISFVNQARPVLEKRCTVCHGCYDAPCQLKLTSIEGIERGANPEKIYNAERIFPSEPTRLFIDATSEKEWRAKGFHTVLNNQQDNEINNLRHSVLYKMLRLKQLNPQARVGMIDEKIDMSLGREQTCPTNEKFDDYVKKFPQQGMPFAMPNLSDDEYHVLVKWISQGMPDDSLYELTKQTSDQINKWEKFFNQADLKHKLVSRYLYEHLFLGHLHFEGANAREYFRLVRSATPPGSAISEIATTRPYDDPGVAEFYYRLRYVKSSIVDKSHVVYELSDKRMQRYKELFFKPKYEVENLPSYKTELASNPIKTFTGLPVISRYRFLLDDAKFFIEGFIKGPVCRGQVALNVIEDNFWVFFTSPEEFRINSVDEYINSMANDFNLPAEQGNTLNLFSTWTNYWDLKKEYMLKRQAEFKSSKQIGLDEAMEYIWDGKGAMDKKNSALTIFRHFDSATVKQGLIGDYPDTAWILDFPTLESIHYLLVAGYDVNGNIGHQFNTRIYMDFLRMDAENVFLAFLPTSHRKKIRESWYQGIRQGLIKYFKEPEEWLKIQIVNGFKTDDPQREFYHRLEKRIKKSTAVADNINRCDKNCRQNQTITEIDRQIQRIAKLKGEILIIFPDTAFLKVISKEENHVYTLINNKAYKNVSSLLSETANRDRSFDTMTIYKGILGSYPNFFLKVEESELESFADKILAIRNRDDYERFVSTYGIRRTSSGFWEEADWFSEQYARQDPVNYGIFDLYRYRNR